LTTPKFPHIVRGPTKLGELFGLPGADAGRGRLRVGGFRAGALGIVENFPIPKGREQLLFSEPIAGLILLRPLGVCHKGLHQYYATRLEAVPDLGEKGAIQIEKANGGIEAFYRQREIIQIGNDQVEPQSTVKGCLT